MGLMLISNFCLVNFIVLRMGTYKPDPDHGIRIINSHNKPVMVAFYIKNDTMIFQDGSVRVIFFNFGRTFPFGFFCFLVPCFKLLFTIGMLIPEIPQCSFGNYSQAVYLNKDKISSQNGKLKFSARG